MMKDRAHRITVRLNMKMNDVKQLNKRSVNEILLRLIIQDGPDILLQRLLKRPWLISSVPSYGFYLYTSFRLK